MNLMLGLEVVLFVAVAIAAITLVGWSTAMLLARWPLATGVFLLTTILTLVFVIGATA